MNRRITGQDHNFGIRVRVLFSEGCMRVFDKSREPPREAPPSRCEMARRRPDPSALDLQLTFTVQREPYSTRLDVHVAQVEAQL